MKKFLFVASLVAVALLVPGSDAKAQGFGIGFETPVDFNFGLFDNYNGNGADYQNAEGVTRLTFSGLALSNHIPTDASGDAQNGDIVQTVAGVVATGYFVGGPGNESQLNFVGQDFSGAGAPSVLELTATLEATGVMFNVLSNGQFEVFLTDATVKFYVDNIDPTAPPGSGGNFDQGDASTWSDGVQVAEWDLVDGTGIITFLGSAANGSTELGSVLTSQFPGFLTSIIPDLVGNLFSFVTTDDEPLEIPDIVDGNGGAYGPLPANIDGVFAGFSTNWAVGVDVRAAIDGSQTYDAVPEPSSIVLLSMGGVALAGVAYRRRRNAKKAA